MSPAMREPLAERCEAGDHGRMGTYCSSAAWAFEAGAEPDLERALSLWRRACDAEEVHPAHGPDWACRSVDRVRCQMDDLEGCADFGLSGSVGHPGAAAARAKACQGGVARACEP